MRSLPSEREVGLTENKTLAEWNLGQEDRIDKLRAEVLLVFTCKDVVLGVAEL